MTVRTALHRSVPIDAIPEFTPVPRKIARHDGWTPERQIAYIHALADTGCVAIACRMVNMSQPSAYQLRRQPGAESFRAAWDAAQTLGLQPVKDEAFDRAMNGEMIPVFVAGKLMGFRRKKNDRLLMFILRHYGQDATGRRTTINYFSTRATAGAAAPSGRQPTRSDALTSARDAGSGRPTTGEAVSIDVTNSVRDGGSALAAAEASTTTVKTVITGADTQPQTQSDDEAAATLNAFAGVELDAEAQDQIYLALAACAERRRALEADPENDPERFFIGAEEAGDYLGQLESGVEGDWVEYRSGACPEQGRRGEHRWENLGEGGEAEEIDRVVGGIKERLASETREARQARLAAEDALIQAQYEKANRPLPGGAGGQSPALPGPALSAVEGPVLSEVEGDDPRLDWRNWSGGEGGLPSSPTTAHPEPVEGPVHSDEPAPAKVGDGSISPRTGKPIKRYKKREPKPPFTPPDERRKAEAVMSVLAERRVGAASEAERRRGRES
jgi:hypothetical protein